MGGEQIHMNCTIKYTGSKTAHGWVHLVNSFRQMVPTEHNIDPFRLIEFLHAKWQWHILHNGVVEYRCHFILSVERNELFFVRNISVLNT